MRTELRSKGFEEANGGWRAADDAAAKERAAAGYTSYSGQPQHFATRARACACLARGATGDALADCVREGWGSQ